MNVSHQVFVFQRRHHDDYPDVLLPHHPPEVNHSVSQGTLRADEVPLGGTTLKKEKPHRHYSLDAKRYFFSIYVSIF